MTRRDRHTPVPRHSGTTRRVTTVLATTVLLAACTSDGGDAEPSPPPPPSASEAVLDLSAMPVDRADPCPVLLEDDVVEALGAEVARTGHYGNGEEVEVTPGVVDVSHEYGCVFEAADGTAARLWVFARPVPWNEARTLVRRTRSRDDCAFPEPLVFGDPGVISACELPSPGRGEPATYRARFEGLFTDTWVGCEVTEPATASDATGSASPTRQDVLQRAEQWCTAALTSAAAAS